MDAAEERGYLRLLLRAAKEPDCGLPDDDSQLAIMSLLGLQWNKPTADKSRRIGEATSGQKVRKCFFEKDGRIFNIRLLREFENQKRIRAVRAEAGKHGGRPKKQTETNSFTNVKANGKQNETSPSPSFNTSSNEEVKDSCSSDDEREFRLQSTERMFKPAERITAWFEHKFWPLYPRKVAKQAALKAALKALPAKKPVDIIAGLQAQLPKFEALIAAGEIASVPHAKTWLNARRWEDEIEPPGRVPATGVVVRMEQRNGVVGFADMISERSKQG